MNEEWVLGTVDSGPVVLVEEIADAAVRWELPVWVRRGNWGLEGSGGKGDA